MRQLALTLAAMFALAIPASANAGIKLDDNVPSNPQVRIGKLPNGLRYFIQRNNIPAGRLELRLVVKAGSVKEDPDQLGVAHFVEHMAFNGTTNFRRNDLVSYFEQIGSKFGSDLNAFTGFDDTTYVLSLPTQRKHVEQGFQVLEDWAHGVSFDQNEIDAERNILLEEARSRKGVGDRLMRATLPKLYEGSLYAERLPIGKEEVIRTVTADTLKRFYRDWYRPDLMAVVAVGNIDPDEAERLVKHHFSKLVNPESPRLHALPPIQERQTAEGIVLTDREASQDIVTIQYGTTAVKHDLSFQTMRDNIKRTMIERMIGERMQSLSQQENSPFVSGGAAFRHHLFHHHTFTAEAIVGSAGVQAAVNALVEETERVRRHGFMETELDRVRKRIMRSYELSASEADKRPSHSIANDLVGHFRLDIPVPHPVDDLAYAKELIPGISLREVNAYAREAIPHAAQKLVIFRGSDKQAKALPDGQQLLAMTRAFDIRHVAAPVDKAVAASLLEKVPAAGTIVAEEQDSKLGLTTLTLSNGLRVVLKQTTFTNGQVVLDAQRAGGHAMLPENDLMLGRMLAAIVSNQGWNGHTPADYQKILAGKAVSVSFSFGELNERFGATTGAADLETMFQALHSRFLPLNRDEAIFRGQMAKLADLTRNQMAAPGSKFAEAILEAVGNGHPRAARLVQAGDFAKMTLGRAAGIYTERFSSAKGFDFVIVGNFEMENMKRLVATYLASLPTPEINLSLVDSGVRPPKGVVERKVRAGTEAKGMLAMAWTSEAPFSKSDALLARALAEVMTLRITESLREKHALIYSGSMRSTSARLPVGQTMMHTDLQFAPENADKVSAALLAEVEALKVNGPSQADLDKVKRNLVLVERGALKNNAVWAGRLSDVWRFGDKPESILEGESGIKDLTTDRLKEAANRYFGPNLVKVRLMPEK